MKFEQLKEYLEEYFKRCGSFNTRYANIKKRKHSWIPYKSEEYNEYYGEPETFYPNHRLILPSEVVIDVDNKDEFCKLMCLKVIRESGLYYGAWDSGNNGLHIHLWFKGLEKYSSGDRTKIKEYIIKHYFSEELIDKCMIDMQLTGTHLIRCEYGVNEKSGYYKEPIEEFNELEYNETPEQVIEKFKAYEKDKLNFVFVKHKFDGSEPPCIKFFQTEDFSGNRDGRKMSLFVLASWYINKEDKQTVYDKLKKWNRCVLNDYLPNDLILSTVNGSKGLCGCRARKNVLRMIDKVKEVCIKCDRYNPGQEV